MRFSGLIPGFHNPDHRRAFDLGRGAFLAAGGPRRCASRTKAGLACGGWALRGEDYCAHHAPVPVRQARRLRLLSRPGTAAQANRAVRREHARVQRVIWQADRWTGGQTVTLGPREYAFEADAVAAGLSPERWAPASRDAGRWAWLQVQAGRVTLDQFRARMLWHAAKDEAGV